MKLTDRGRDWLWVAQFTVALILALGIVGMLDGAS